MRPAVLSCSADRMGGMEMPRAIWSGSISFGMVSIPVKLFGATESKDIRFSLLHATCGTKLQQKRWCPTDEVEVPWSELRGAMSMARANSSSSPTKTSSSCRYPASTPST